MQTAYAIKIFAFCRTVRGQDHRLRRSNSFGVMARPANVSHVKKAMVQLPELSTWIIRPAQECDHKRLNSL